MLTMTLACTPHFHGTGEPPNTDVGSGAEDNGLTSAHPCPG